MSRRRSRAPSNSDEDSPSLRNPPRLSHGGGRGRRSGGGDEFRSSRRRRRHIEQAYKTPEGKQSSNVKLRFSVFNGTSSHCWRFTHFYVDSRWEGDKEGDKKLWEEIQGVYSDELQGAWRRIYGFRKLKQVVPVEYSSNNVPYPIRAKDDPINHIFMHALVHPHHIESEREWIDWFTNFRPKKHRAEIGLEFQEGLWAEKLAIIAILLTIAIVIVSVVWVVKGGQLQTVFTVMGFVLTGAAAEIALIALYFQVTQIN